MNIEDILRQKTARIVSIRMNETIADAIQLLYRQNIGAVVVQDVCQSEGNTIVGMFSERDLVRLLAEEGPSALKKSVEKFKSQHITSCAPTDSVEHALNLMVEHHVRHLPVLDNFTLIGVISMRDIAVTPGRPEITDDNETARASA